VGADTLRRMDSNAAIPPAYVPPAYVPPVPVQPKSRKKMWVIIILSVLLFLFLLIAGCCTALYFGVTKALKSSQVYVMSIQRAQASPCAISKLGQPINAQGLPQGSSNENNDSGSADLTIPIQGPQGSGSLHAIASRDNKVWTLTSLTLNAGGAQYDLPATPGPCEP
jgi:Cytochrome oxidase complex assembly protein 1